MKPKFSGSHKRAESLIQLDLREETHPLGLELLKSGT
jgi:hypothetical protein